MYTYMYSCISPQIAIDIKITKTDIPTHKEVGSMRVKYFIGGAYIFRSGDKDYSVHLGKGIIEYMNIDL
jgi:hypothetical protein